MPIDIHMFTARTFVACRPPLLLVQQQQVHPEHAIAAFFEALWQTLQRLLGLMRVR